jgi:hypothetical protein
MGAQSYILETQVRRAEALTLRGEFDTASSLAHDLLDSMDHDAHTALQRAALTRVLAYGRLASGHVSDGVRDLETSLELSRVADSAFEVALTLEGLLRIAGSDPRAEEWKTEELAVFERLGVRATPVVPLSVGSEAGLLQRELRVVHRLR